ncbi:HAMP domain-containing sensor histidine kinase [Phenylobacterium sp.]|uniref:sensor histidine kinase n=1 Tax=Phenylobacterium sp. TaxID=1871053 RepID=UPI0028A2B378|nr:HAMP domain-containing sensor histidine kinase [Phenylobacterium sp.]
MADAPSPSAPKKPPTRRFFWPGGLSARLLLLTILFVAGASAIALPAALASFEEQWLLDRVRAAELASMATEVAPDQILSENLASQLREVAGVQTVAVLDNDGNRFLKVPGPRLEEPPYLVDLRDQAPASWLSAPFQTLFGGADGRMVRVIAEPRFYRAQFIEVVAPDTELKAELTAYLWRLLAIMGFVSFLAGGLVYLSLNYFLVRPMQRITRSMERFAADPEDTAAHIAPSGRRDEVGRAEVQLERMQEELRAALQSRARLAALGEAVAKINHDLRNMLTSAQIASERLAALKDPQVTQAMPRLERALDRAVKLASDVLAYGKTEEAAPDARPVLLSQILEGAEEEARLSPEGVRLISLVDRADQVNADPDQLHRILVNLMRNARQAIEQQAGRETPGSVQVSLFEEDGVSVIRLADNGPGVSERARERLFQPFAGSTRPGGAGLGLAIARELAQGHGGDLALAETGPQGSVFELRLPGAPTKAPTPKRRRSKTREV